LRSMRENKLEQKMEVKMKKFKVEYLLHALPLPATIRAVAIYATDNEIRKSLPQTQDIIIVTDQNDSYEVRFNVSTYDKRVKLAITDTAGVLSHFAIILREINVPFIELDQPKKKIPNGTLLEVKFFGGKTRRWTMRVLERVFAGIAYLLGKIFLRGYYHAYFPGNVVEITTLKRPPLKD